MTQLHFTTDISLPLKEAFQLGTSLDNLPLIQPGFIKILRGGGKHQIGKHFTLLFWQDWLPTLWFGKISEWEENHYFSDVQVIGPFKSWRHTHRFISIPQGTRLEDEVEYELWGGILGDWLDRKWIKRRLEKMFSHRQMKIKGMFPIR